jgi:hypothetical protein
MFDPADFTAAGLATRIEIYFDAIEEGYPPAKKTTAGAKSDSHIAQQSCAPESGPPTLSGLSYFLGFESREAFADYETNGKFSSLLKRARLRIEIAYEKKLHHQSSAGAIFALKSMGWNEKADDKTGNGPIFKTLTVEVIETGPALAATEKEVDLQ